MKLNQISHRSYIIDHVTIVDPKQNTSFAGHLVVMEGKIDAVTPGRALPPSMLPPTTRSPNRSPSSRTCNRKA